MGHDRGAGKTVRVFPDYHADPVWTDGRLEMVDLDSLSISPKLRTRLRTWARDWEDLMGMAEARYEVLDRTAHAEWKVRGSRLADALQAELGDAVQVRYDAG